MSVFFFFTEWIEKYIWNLRQFIILIQFSLMLFTRDNNNKNIVGNYISGLNWKHFILQQLYGSFKRFMNRQINLELFLCLRNMAKHALEKGFKNNHCKKCSEKIEHYFDFKFKIN